MLKLCSSYLRTFSLIFYICIYVTCIYIHTHECIPYITCIYNVHIIYIYVYTYNECIPYIVYIIYTFMHSHYMGNL